jgi:hypothetical protein
MTGLRPVNRREFHLCPTCLAPDPTSKEQVPQGSIGGQVMTLSQRVRQQGRERVLGLMPQRLGRRLRVGFGRSVAGAGCRPSTGGKDPTVDSCFWLTGTLIRRCGRWWNRGSSRAI